MQVVNQAYSTEVTRTSTSFGNTGIDAVIALQEAVTDTWVLGSSTAGTKMEDADEILGNFKYFKIYVNGSDATEARIWIAS